MGQTSREEIYYLRRTTIRSAEANIFICHPATDMPNIYLLICR